MPATDDAQSTKLHTDRVVSVSYGEIGVAVSVAALLVLLGALAWRKSAARRPDQRISAKRP